MNNPMQLIQQFQQFKQTFSGNPQQMVMQMVQSGKISQAQLNQVQSMATQFQQLLGSTPH